jgi:predicted adenylyl cyclase CyaB
MKARVACFDKMQVVLEALSDAPCQVLDQEDTFFRTSSGRLKLRIVAGRGAEIIYYERSDVPELRESCYLRYPVLDPALLHRVMSAALGVEGVVRKRRLLYLVGQTRLHLDTVENLGTFLEMEVVLTPGQGADEGRRIAEELAGRLQIAADDLVPCAYVDLLRDSATLAAKT